MTADREVGIVGFGRCGQLAARVLRDVFRVRVTDRQDRSAEARACGVPWEAISAVAGSPRVLIAVPIRELPGLLDAIRPFLRPGALVIDVASVKVRPMGWMADRLPSHVRWAGTHPLFGPESVAEQGIRGQRIAICSSPGQVDAADEVADLARLVGLMPVRWSPEEHDRLMARSQAIVFLLSRSLRRAGIATDQEATPSERRFFAALRMVEGDSAELYEDILMQNPFSAEVAESIAAALDAEIVRLRG